jgi:putative SOS response-associated peptidase YedK
MCNLYRIDAPANQIAAAFDADAGDDLWLGGYVAPSRFGPVVVGRSRRRVAAMAWGIPPPPNGTAPVTNVRNLESPFWIGSLRNPDLRCLIPATRFQEWSGPRGQKRQHWFSVPDQPIFAFAGLWRDDGELPYFAMLTTEPNALVEPIHPKAMPMILHPEDHETWLNGDWKLAQKLVGPFPSQLMAVETMPGARQGL